MAITTGPNLGLMQNGAQGEQHYTEILRFFRGIDGLVMLSVADKDLTAPPASGLTDGVRYLVAAAPTGAWAGKAGQIARYSATTASWEFFAPRAGWFTHVTDENAVYRHTGAAWELWQGPAAAGWATPTGTATRTTFDTATVTTAQLAERLKALIDDLKAQGRLTA